jgi:hypothetical protein
MCLPDGTAVCLVTRTKYAIPLRSRAKVVGKPLVQINKPVARARTDFAVIRRGNHVARSIQSASRRLWQRLNRSALTCHREQCTQGWGQINICWSTSDNILGLLNATKLNETYSSLSSAFPTASSYTIDRAALFQFTSTSATRSASATEVPATAAATESSPPESSSSRHNRLSGEATGGIVGGVIGGLALLVVASFFLWCRRKVDGKGHARPLVTEPYQSTDYQQEVVHAKGTGPHYSALTNAQ